MRHTLVARVQDHPGVLNRVASLFRRQQFHTHRLGEHISALNSPTQEFLRNTQGALTLRGSATRETAGAIATQVQDEIAKHGAARVLIDVRKIEGRLGTFETHALVRNYRRDLSKHRVAVVDLESNRFANRFHEQVATGLGFQIRFFEDAEAAETWLQAEDQ